MTKTQWLTVLKQLQHDRSTRKFRSAIIYRYVNSGELITKWIEVININKDGFIKFGNLVGYLKYDDVKRIPLSTFKLRFQVSMSPFDIIKTRFL